MLCTTNSPFLWAKIGFIAYTFLPGLNLHAILRILRRRANLFWIYVIPTTAALLAVISPNFILDAKCMSVFIQTQIAFRNSGGIFNQTLYWIYLLYYSGFIAIALGYILRDYLHQRNMIKKEIDLVEIIGAFMMLAPTVILTMLLPHLNVRFPSILCFFAIFFAIATFAIAYLETKLKKKSKK